ncbi:MAG: hypothetical protein HXK83_04150 [Lachnospiraceae bacterium]|nr:hypothetical protein [Lachnospiraceae bacterium]
MADRNEYLDGILNNITDLDGQQDPDSLQKHVEKKADSLRKTARNHASLEREFFAAENDLLELNDMLDKADRNVVVSDGLKQLMDHYGEITEQEASPLQIGPSAEETDLRDKEEKSLDDLIAVLEKGSVRHNSGEPLQDRDVESSINPRSSSSLPDSNTEQLEEKPLPTIDSVPGMEEITDPQKALRDLNIDVLLDKAEAQMKEQTESADQEEDASSFASASSQEAEKSLTEEIPPEAEESPSETEESPSEAEEVPSETEEPPSSSEVAFFEREAGPSAEEDSVSEVEEDSISEVEEGSTSEVEEGSTSEVEEGSTSEVEEDSISEAEEGSASEVEEDSTSEVEEDSTPETEESTSQTEEISLHSFLESPEGEDEETTPDHQEHLAPEDLKDSISAQIAAVLSGEDLQASLKKAQTEDGMEQNNPHSEQEETGTEADIPDLGQENHSEEKLSIPEEIKETEVDLKDLDKIMDSLATDHIDDIENEKGQASKEDIEALQAAMMDELGDQGQEGEDSAHPLGKKRKERKKSGQKQGLFAKIKAFFASLSEDEEEEETADHLTQEGSETKENKAEKDLATGHEGPKEKNPAKEEEQLASLTEENSQVLKELNEEDAQAAEKKKKKKKKPKKEKKPKKAPKPKKPKKAPEPPQGPPPKRIPPKRIILVGVFAVTFGILVYLPSEVFPEPLVVKQAKSSYKKGEYWNTYKDLYGKSAVLTKDQQEEFKKAEVISKMQRYYDEYADYSSVVGKEPEALNALIKGVGRYDEIYKEAKETGDPKVEEEVSNTYDDLVTALQDDYHLTEDLAKQLYAIEDPIEYTIRLQWITGVRGAAEE